MFVQLSTVVCLLLIWPCFFILLVVQNNRSVDPLGNICDAFEPALPFGAQGQQKDCFGVCGDSDYMASKGADEGDQQRNVARRRVPRYRSMYARYARRA